MDQSYITNLLEEEKASFIFGENVSKIAVGDLSDEEIALIINLRNKRNDLENKIEAKTQELIIESKRQIDEIFKTKLVQLEFEHGRIWSKVAERNEICPRGRYKIELSEKRVYEIVESINK